MSPAGISSTTIPAKDFSDQISARAGRFNRDRCTYVEDDNRKPACYCYIEQEGEPRQRDTIKDVYYLGRRYLSPANAANQKRIMDIPNEKVKPKTPPAHACHSLHTKGIPQKILCPAIKAHQISVPQAHTSPYPNRAGPRQEHRAPAAKSNRDAQTTAPKP